jgi:alpha-glucosidase (family GH31 glycosyl hydrolase)
VVWRDENRGGSREVLDDVARFRDLKIPITALWIDRPYSRGNSGWSAMDFNDLFPHPEVWVRTLRETYGVELMTWIAPAVFAADDSFPGLFRNYVGYFDLSNAAAVAEFGRRVNAGQYAFGVRGHKMDRADEYFPLYQRWADSTPAEAQRNRYLYLYARVADDMLRRAWGADQFNFARAAYHRTQPYLSAVWGGDSRSTWEGMAANLANGIRCGFMGFPVWGSDVGGYLGVGHIPEDLYARWLELGAWSGLFEVKLDGAGGSGEDRPPWKYSPRLQAIFRAATGQRMQLLPTLYSLANTSAHTGVLMQPLAYAFPRDTATFAIADEFLLGGIFLVAPVLSPGESRSVYLPRGRWYDLADPGRVLEGGRRLQMSAPLERIPVLVRAGSIYVTGDVFAGSRRGWTPAFDGTPRLTIHAYPASAPGRTRFLYVDSGDDDGEKPITLATTTDRLDVSAPALSLAGDVDVHLPRAPRRVTLGGAQVDAAFDPATRVLRVPFPAEQELALVVEY